MPSAARHFRETLAWLILVSVLVVPGMVGTLGSILAVVAALLFAIPALRVPGAREEVVRQPAMPIFVGAFIVLTAVFAITATEPADIRFAFNFLAFLLAPAVYLMARERPAGDATLVVSLALVGVGASAAMAAAEVAFLGIDRAAGLFGGPNLLPRVAIPLGFLALGGVLFVTSRYRVLFYLGPLLAIAVTALSGSRGAALALPLLVVIAAVALALRRDTRRHLLVLGAATILVLVAVVLIAPGESARLLSTLSMAGHIVAGTPSGDPATVIRQAMFNAGWTAFQSAPILGYGWANLGDAAALADPSWFAAVAGTAFMFHNDVINFAVAAGVIGIAVLAAVLLAPLIGVMRAERDKLFAFRIYGALVLSGSHLVFGFSDMTIGYDLTTTLHAFLTALVLGVRPELTSSAASPASRP